MKHLRELSRILTDLGPKKIDAFTLEGNYDQEDKYLKLFYGAQTGKYKSDEDAIQDIYGSHDGYGTYQTLKSRLKGRMLNSLFFLDVGQYSESAQAFYWVSKNLFWFQILLRFGARSFAIKLGESTIKKAEHYQLTSALVILFNQLRYHQSLTGSMPRYEDYSKRLKESLKTLEAEHQAAELYERLIIKFATTTAELPELTQLANDYAQVLQELHRNCNSYEVAINYYRVKTIASQISQQFEVASEICTEALNYLKEYPHLTQNLRLGEFVLYKLNSQLYLRDYENGRDSIEQCKTLFTVGSNNWFTYMENHFLLAMHTAHFEEAKDVYQAVASHTRFRSLAEPQIEKWRLFELYLQYACGIESNINAARFLRVFPTYSKDKRGNNVALLILHILFLLNKKDYKGIINRMDALRTYRSRYLRLATSRQSALFFKLLLVMERSSFSYSQTADKGKVLFSQLQHAATDYSEINEGLQVLPYDWLWERILEQLRKNDQ